MLAVSLIGGLRLARRLSSEVLPAGIGNRVLIVGAGNAGEMIARDLRKKGHQPIGFIDDDPAKQGQTIHRVRVLGTRNALPAVVAAEHPDQVLIAMPSADAATVRQFITALEQFKVPITTLPPPREIVNGHVTLSQVRRVAVEDLLPRLPVHFDLERARGLVEGQRVMITGAGGCIGSELCRQVAGLDPDRLVVYERYENNLYGVLNTLPRSFRIKAALGDVTDKRRLHAVMREFRPHLIFHAAAHKHVPLMELNPCEAVKNNVLGTRMVAEAAAHFGVDRFILISTDKAVNPCSLMGATKRAAELVVQAMAARGGPRWATVRFGNVLGSTGSVIPRWQEQIAAGGPVTVTHAEARRYFMLIPEAVHLILQAASVTTGGEIFALEMGEQINLMKMARDLIRLSGYIPDDEIAITITGLRPGEKLSEELVGPDEQLECSPVEKITQLRALTPPDPRILLSQVTELVNWAIRGDAPGVIEQLCRVCPTFHPGPSPERMLRAGAPRENAAPTGRRASVQLGTSAPLVLQASEAADKRQRPWRVGPCGRDRCGPRPAGRRAFGRRRAVGGDADTPSRRREPRPHRRSGVPEESRTSGPGAEAIMTRETRGSTRCDPLWCAALGGALALMATPVGAQQPSEPTDGRPPATFEWRPSAALTNAGYDSNVFNQPVNAKGDFFAVVSAGLMPAWRLGDAKLEGGAHLTYNYFHEYDSERALDGAFDGRAELPVGATRVHVDGKYLNARQRVNFEIDQRARRSESNFGGGIDVPVGDRITAIFKVQRSGYAFADEPGINADLSHTLNRVENGGSATLNYAVTPLTAIELNGTYGNHRFEFAPERDGSRARGDVSLVLDSDALIGGRASVGLGRLQGQ